MKLSFFIMLACSCSMLGAQLLNIPLNDQPFDYKFGVPTHTYHAYCRNVYSQNGEDGILEQLIYELGITAGTFCEFGASDGIYSSNTYNLIKNYGFSGIAIELDKSLYTKCVATYESYPNVQVYHGAVLYNNMHYDLNAWLKRGNLPCDFDILSIDIDYDDYYVWEQLTDFAPKIVIFETNSYRDPVYDELPGKASKEYATDLLQQWHPARVAVGCSFISAVKLGLEKGYIPVSYTGNIIFVRKDLVTQLHEFPYHVSDNPYDYLPLYTHLVLWKDRWMTNTGLIVNVAIRDYYLQFKRKAFDLPWIETRMQQIMRNENVLF